PKAVPINKITMKSTRLICLLLILACSFSCKTSKKEGQGIQGQVFWLEGNQMPQITDDGKAASRLGKVGLQRTVRIHELTHINKARSWVGLLDDIETALVAKIETDESGNMSISRPPGKYSILTVEEDVYFANIFDQDSYIYPLEVREGEWT